MQAAAQRHLDFSLGLYADPIYFGDYPQSVKALVPSLPALTDQEKASLNGSVDYFALNHYNSYYVNNDPASGTLEGTAVSYISSAGVGIGEQAESSWLYVVPWGFRCVLPGCWSELCIMSRVAGGEAKHHFHITMPINIDTNQNVCHVRQVGLDSATNMQDILP